MNKEDYVSLEVAKLLNEKRIELPTRYYRIDENINNYETGDLLHKSDIHRYSLNILHAFPAPSLYDVQKLLRDKYYIAVNPYNRVSTNGVSWSYEFNNIKTCKSVLDRNTTFIGFDTYEEALNNGILRALKF